MAEQFTIDKKYAEKMDRNDPLKKYRNRFYVKDNEIYMDGNSLGLFSRDAEESLLRVIDEWKQLAIDCWSKAEKPLFLYQDYLGKLLSSIIGANEDEVTVHASTTINIHTAIATFYKPDKKRYKILVDDLNFSTDRYAVDSQVKLKGLDPVECVKVVNSRDGKYIYEEDFVNAMTDDVAIIFLPAVLYRTGQLLNIAYITKEANKRGIFVGWDLCHSIGAVPLDLNELEVDFAVWCNYKYLNGGPGSSAGLYINRKHFEKDPGLAGWHGNVNETQFDLNQKFEPASNAGGWQTGTQHILSMAPLEGSLKMFNEVGVERLREKSLKITAYLMYLIDNKLAKYDFSVATPRNDKRRGGHVALEHDEAIRINEALKDNGVIPDFRAPNIIRLAPIAFYNTYKDVWKLVEIIEDIMVNKKYEKYEIKRGLIA